MSSWGECPICRGEPTLRGVNCGACGHHFHVGNLSVIELGAAACPRCEAIAGTPEGDPPVEPAMPTSEEGLIDIVCGEVEPAVAKRIRKVAATRRSSDPQYWANVMLRESWHVEHGSYEGWDAPARAMGQDPTMYGPAR